MNDRKKAGRKARLFVLSLLLLAACSKHDVQYPTLWLRVDVARPRADGLIRIGSIEERWDVKVGDRWQKLGVGHRSGYAILGEEAVTASAAIVMLDDPRGPVLARPDAEPLRLRGEISFPNSMNFDLLQHDGHEAHIDRYDATGKQAERFDIAVPSDYSDCTIVGIRGYLDGIPYLATACKPSSSQARCVLIGAAGTPVYYVVKPDQAPTDCEFSQLHLTTYQPYHVFN